MPGCGKTTVAKQIAKSTGKKLIDIDAEIEKKTGRTVPDIINNDGEPYFRELETAEIMLAGKESGKVIATGGGAVTRKENYFPLRQNGRIYYLTRDIGLLVTEGRPLSRSIEALHEMYKERLPLYRGFADREIDCNVSAAEAARMILEDFNENTGNQRA